jgi:hypothetical protein
VASQIVLREFGGYTSVTVFVSDRQHGAFNNPVKALRHDESLLVLPEAAYRRHRRLNTMSKAKEG